VRDEEYCFALSSAGPALSAPAHAATLARAEDDSVNAKSIVLAPVSAIIPTKGRAKDLRGTVKSLLEGNELPSELIIVDQSADRSSYDAVHDEFRKARIRQSLLPRLKYIHDPAIPGVSAARNVALSLAAEAIWLFLDDDVVMEPDFVKELMNAYAGPAAIDGVSGIITNYPLPAIAFRAWLWIFERGPFADPRQPIYWNANALIGAENIEVPILTSALMSMRADAVRGVQFDERAGVCQCEDTDYCLALGKNARLLIAPRARLQHLKSPAARPVAHPIQRPALSYAFLFRKHFDARLLDRIRFYWLCAGLALMAIMASVRRGSLEPWRTFACALPQGLAAGRESADAARRAASKPTRVRTNSQSSVSRDEPMRGNGSNGRSA